jgi:hypothetical protein
MLVKLRGRRQKHSTEAAIRLVPVEFRPRLDVMFAAKLPSLLIDRGSGLINLRGGFNQGLGAGCLVTNVNAKPGIEQNPDAFIRV